MSLIHHSHVTPIPRLCHYVPRLLFSTCCSAWYCLTDPLTCHAYVTPTSRLCHDYITPTYRPYIPMSRLCHNVPSRLLFGTCGSAQYRLTVPLKYVTPMWLLCYTFVTPMSYLCHTYVTPMSLCPQTAVLHMRLCPVPPHWSQRLERRRRTSEESPDDRNVDGDRIHAAGRTTFPRVLRHLHSVLCSWMYFLSWSPCTK